MDPMRFKYSSAEVGLLYEQFIGHLDVVCRQGIRCSFALKTIRNVNVGHDVTTKNSRQCGTRYEFL